MNVCRLCPKFRRPGKSLPAETGSVCRICLEVVDQDLVDLDHLAPAIPDALEPRTSGGGAGHAPAGPRLPVSLDALNLMGPGADPAGLLREYATNWAVSRGLFGVPAEWREYRTAPNGRIVLPVTGLAGLVTWIRDRLGQLAHHHDFPTFAGRVHTVLAQIRRVVIDGAYPRPAGWCPAGINDEGDQCMAPLAASTWVDVIACPGCGARYDRARGQWDALVQLGTRTEMRRSA